MTGTGRSRWTGSRRRWTGRRRGTGRRWIGSEAREMEEEKGLVGL